MLVHYSQPHGILYINGYRIYGEMTGHAPTDISFPEYEQWINDGLVIEATYREGFLSQRYKRPFSEIAFKYSEIHCYPYQTLMRLIIELGAKKTNCKKHTWLVTLIKRFIRSTSPNVKTNSNS